jgi:hypothetical protein
MTKGKVVVCSPKNEIWKMKRWFEFEDDFRWAMMVGLKGLCRVH